MLSGAAGSMSRGVFGRTGYEQSGFIDDEGPDDQQQEQQKPTRKRSEDIQPKDAAGGWLTPKTPSATSSKSPKPAEATVKKERADTWDQAATIRAQLEEELKTESVTKSSPTQRHLTRPASASHGALDVSDGFNGDSSREKKKSDRHKKKKGSPDVLFAVPAVGFPDAAPQVDKIESPEKSGPGADPWQTSPTLAAESAPSKGSPKPTDVFGSSPTALAAGFAGIWDSAPGVSFAWPQKPVSPSPAPAIVPPTPPALAAAAATSLADGFAMYGVAEGFHMGHETDSLNGDLTLPTEVSDKSIEHPPSPFEPVSATSNQPRSGTSEVSSEVTPRPQEPLPGMFDEAILAALAALPQQALIGVLRQLASQRPAEVAAVFGGERAIVQAPLPQPPSGASLNVVAEGEVASPVADAATTAPLPQVEDVAEPVIEGIAAAVDGGVEAAPTLAENFAENVASEAASAPPHGVASNPSSEATSPVIAPATAAAPSAGDPVAVILQDDVWPAARASTASDTNAFDTFAAPASASSPWPPAPAAAAVTSPQATDFWGAPPETAGVSPDWSAGALATASPWPVAPATASPWP